MMQVTALPDLGVVRLITGLDMVDNQGNVWALVWSKGGLNWAESFGVRTDFKLSAHDRV